MKLTFAASIDKAPKGYVRVRLTEEDAGIKRIVRENGIEWLELGAGKPSEMNLRKFMRLCRAIVRAAKAGKYTKVALQFDRTPVLFKNLGHVTPEEISTIAAQKL